MMPAFLNNRQLLLWQLFPSILHGGAVSNNYTAQILKISGDWSQDDFPVTTIRLVILFAHV
jgi:hypothetical protein